MVAEIEPIPVAALGPEPLPQAKRRGRPPKLNPDGTRANPPKPPRASTPRKPSTRKPTTRKPSSTRSLASEIAGMLTLVNSLLIMSPLGTRPFEAIDDPTVTPTKLGDELDAAEIGALAGAIDAQARRSPRFRKMIEGMLTAGAGGQLVGVVALIAVRRAARHGIAPPMLDPMLGGMIAGGDLAAAMSFVAPDPVPEPSTDENIPNRDAGLGFDVPPLNFDTL